MTTTTSSFQKNDNNFSNNLFFLTLVFNWMMASLADQNQDLIAKVIHRGRDHGLPTYKQVTPSVDFVIFGTSPKQSKV
jgi:hypothetical protein